MRPSRASALLVALIGFAFAAFVSPASAAEFFFESDRSEAKVGEPFEARLFLDTEFEDVNAIEGVVRFPPRLVELEGIRDGGSVVNFWVERPAVSEEGRVRFSGITPGGYAGQRGYVLSLLFRARGEGADAIGISEAGAFRNDGQGSRLEVTAPRFPLTVSGGSGLLWFFPSEKLFFDVVPPEAFVPVVARDENLFGGKYFLAFATQDKGVGISRYEVREALHVLSPRRWRTAESPYVLEDQSLRSILSVKAVDRAGNERVVVLPRTPRPRSGSTYAVLSLILAASLWAYLSRKKR